MTSKAKFILAVALVGAAALMVWVLSRRVGSVVADDVAKFAADEVKSVTVYSLNPVRIEMPRGEFEADQYEEFVSKVSDQHFHQFPILKAVSSTDDRICREIVAAAVDGMRTRASGAKCFDPAHGVRISKGEQTMDLVICYECEMIEVWGEGYAGKHELTADSSREVLTRALQGVK